MHHLAVRILAAIALFSLALPALCRADEVKFNRDIRPFLSDTCFRCHGPDSTTREADLRFDVEASAKADRDGHPAIVANKPEKSEAVARIFSDDPDFAMPPPKSGLKLTAKQKELFRRWVAAGAKYEPHWSLTRIVRPAVTSAVGSPIDAFVRARLADSGLKPSPAAAPEKQLRRASLDLTGLPPTIAEADAFLADVEDRGLDPAYEAAVDRLLRSSRYGEQMAWHWLEAARYADTDGYQNDGPREMWRWRDWIIDAFNRNMPFDQFTIEQLAGDLLPNPTHEQLIATAFNRNNRYNSEEGIPIDEFLLENAVDRVDTTSTVWLGLTMGCARCHDHKYDPISQKEYYQLVDYFNDVAESGRAIKEGNSEPWIKTPTPPQRERLGELERKIEQAKRNLAGSESAICDAQRKWETDLSLSKPILSYGLDHYFSFDAADEKVKAKQGQPRLDDSPHGKAAVVGDGNSFEIGKIPGLIGNGRFSIAFWLKPEQVDKGPALSNEMPGTGRNGILIEFVKGRLRFNINTRWISGVSTVETIRTFQPNKWVHITLTNDGTQRAAGMLIYVNGELQEVAVIRNTNSNKAKRDDGAAMNIGYSKHVGFWKGQLDELRFYSQRTLSPREAALLAVPETIPQIAAIPESKRSELQRELLRTAFLEQADDEVQAKLIADVRQAEADWQKYYDALPTTMIMRDLATPRSSFIRKRGVYDQLGAQVHANVPAVFPPLPKNEENTRLTFAKWLVSPEHPLTPRVTVNRFWQMLFGRGLVKTAEDFGAQGEQPSHPELLDWLAAEFISSGWDQRQLLKTIVLSQTYRQDSAITRQHLAKDPDNVLLARAPRIRLTGSLLRDQALFASGLLVQKLGGPSVMTYQPAGLWEEASNATYKQAKGEDLYRRSLYTYWKRTLAPPTMALLDAGDRENCTVRTKHTNTPLQALTLLNDVTFVEAARKLGERILREGGETDADRITFAFRTVATRYPTAAEMAVLTDALNDYRSEFQNDPKRAANSLKIGQSPASKQFSPSELAAATALANVILNLEEITTRD
ncbi:MAG TPA: DUF1553 domain-containing protein [Pirellulaceae bacterium]|jgi:hypothetical protein